MSMAVLGALLGLVSAVPVFAATADCPSGQAHLVADEASAATCCPAGTENSAKTCFVAKYINPVVSLLSALVGVVVVISIIAGGLQYSSAGSDPNKVGAAKKRIANAVIALIGFIFLFALMQWLIPGGMF